MKNNTNSLNINDFIDKSLKDIYVSNKKTKNSSKLSKSSNYFDKFKIKLKKKKIESNLRPISLKRKFFGSLNKNPAYGPANADGMSSSISADAGISGAGWGAGAGWGVTAFGEGITHSSSQFVDFIRDISTTENNDVVNAICDGYKTIYRNIESESTAILCGIQPSMIDYMTFNIIDFVFAMNNFMGTIVSLYIGEHNSMESENDIKEWYLSIGVDEQVVNNIIFIEKANMENITHSSIEFSINDIKTEKYYIKSLSNLNDLCSEIYNPILIGCADVFFMAELLMEFKKYNKYTQIDKKFIYLI